MSNTHGSPVVAVVDDDPRVLESMADLFESAGFTVQTHLSGKPLLESGVSAIDCLITDIGMPEVDGYELKRRVKAIRPGLPVILISGRHEPGDKMDDLHIGDSLFFRKPFNGQQLLSAVATLLNFHTGG